MAKGKANMSCDSSCGMHLCKQCAFPQIVFGVLFLVVGLGFIPSLAWLNGWTVLGAYLALWGVMSTGTMGKK